MCYEVGNLWYYLAMLVKNKIRKSVEEALATLGVTDPKFAVDATSDLSLGDYAVNAALVYAKELAQNPAKLAEEVRQKILDQGLPEISKIEVAGPGFLNFFLSDEVLRDNLRDILATGNKYGRTTEEGDKKVMVEFTDPNPFKEFHIGHLMSNAIGESLSRLAATRGAEVKRVNYQGDVGMHVAKTIWGLKQMSGDPTSVSDLAQAYVLGAKAYEADHKEEIVDLNKKIYERSDAEVNKLYDQGRQASLDYFETIYARLGSKFDFYFYESATGEFGRRVVRDNMSSGIFRESEGAVIFPGEEYGLHNRVFINSQGLPTYEAKELGLARIKYEAYPYDQSVVITGNEVNAYFQVLLQAMSQVFPDLAAKQVHIGHGMLRLPSGKMSSRTGDVVTAESLIDEVKDRVRMKIDSENRDVADSEEIAEQVAIGAIKYSILKQDIGKDIVFDFDKSISFEGNSGPYLQYMCVRASSVLAKAGSDQVEWSQADQISNLERILIRFPNVLEKAYDEKAPHHICTYLFELASEFSSYYAANPIIGSEYEKYRLALTSAVRQVLTAGLDLLAIPIPAKM